MSRLSTPLIAAQDDERLLAIVLDGIASGRLPLESEADLPALYDWIARLKSAVDRARQDVQSGPEL
jgi:hypothetical protein